jgi:L-amino acid N-acyltransferase YncA/dihydrofolate reductase
MSRISVVNHVTLDGVMQAPGRPGEDTRGGFEHGGWAVPYFDEVLGRAMGERMTSDGAMLLGRRTYEDFAGFWPKQTDNPFTPVLNQRRKYVASTTLTEPLAWENSTLLTGDVGDAVAALDVDLTVLGSGELIRALMQRDLIDEFVLTIHPLVLGTGRRLFRGRRAARHARARRGHPDDHRRRDHDVSAARERDEVAAPSCNHRVMPVRPATAADAAACAAIYAPYVTDTAITFETEVPDADEMAKRIATAAERHAWLVLEDDGRIVGYAYGGPYKARAAYRWACEVSVYVERGRQRTGAGRALYEALLARLAARGYRTAVGGMTLPNDASVGLHRALGFEPVGTYRRIGYKHGAWHDVAWTQRELATGADPPIEPV